mgnify:CR=1 FL=1
MGVIFDTVIFNRMLDKEIKINRITEIKERGSHEFYITHIQEDQLRNTPNEKRRKQLLQIFGSIPSTLLATESSIVGISRFGMSKLSDGALYSELEIHKSYDALIGETAIKNNLILVTEDKALKNHVRRLGGRVMRLKEFFEEP